MTEEVIKRPKRLIDMLYDAGQTIEIAIDRIEDREDALLKTYENLQQVMQHMEIQNYGNAKQKINEIGKAISTHIKIEEKDTWHTRKQE